MKKIMFVALALILGLTACVKDKQYPGITIANVSFSPTAVQDYDDVTVSATISCFSDFTAKLVYIINESSEEVEMIGNEGVYTAVIPAQPDGTTVKFYVEASNSDFTKTSATTEYTVGAAVIDYSGLRLNELNGQDHKKFIEIFNNGMEAINMRGVTIYKDTEKLVWTGKAEVVVEPGAYLVLYSEDVILDHPEIDTTYYIFHSGLSAKKNVRIELKTPAGDDIDDFNLTQIELNGEAYGYSGNQAPDSYSRNANGDWYYSDATPNAENIDGANPVLGLEGGVTPPPTPTPDIHDLILNELNGDTKFIEIYNKGDFDLVLEGLYIEKDDKDAPIWIGDGTITVPAHGYVVLYSEDVVADHPELEGTNYIFGSGLSGKKAIRIALFLANGEQLDIFTRCPDGGTWGDAMSNVGAKSYARTPDAGDWKLADPTPGESNPAEGEEIPME